VGRGRLVSINVSLGGVPKRPVARAAVNESGVAGDAQRDLRYHGGPDRAVSLFALERIEALKAEGHPIYPGSTGENLTVEGIDWSAVGPGAKLRVGKVGLLVTGYASPCSKIAASFREGALNRIAQKLHPGFSRVYARVLTAGELAEGDEVALIPEAAALDDERGDRHGRPKRDGPGY